MFSPAVLILGITMLIAMVCVMIYTGGYYRINKWKSTILAISLTVLCLVSSKIMAIIEGAEESFSLFGAILFGPIFMIPIGLLLRIRLLDMWDMCAPAAALALSVAKINCFFNHCCKGRFLFYVGKMSTAVYFPSQIVECINTLILFVILIHFLKQGKYRGALIPWAMIYYGITRFGLTFLRQRREAFVWILPNGAFWSLVTLAIAVPLMIVYKRNHLQASESKKNKMR